MMRIQVNCRGRIWFLLHWDIHLVTIMIMMTTTKRRRSGIPSHHPTMPNYPQAKDVDYSPPTSSPKDKGSLVHDGTISDVIFPSAHKFREYIFSLPRNYACDAAEWVWMQQLEQDGEYHLLMGINISALMNSGGADWGDEHSKMVNCVPETEYSGKFYAVRDIMEGEEILTDYDVYYTKWSLVGLGEGKRNQ